MIDNLFVVHRKAKSVALHQPTLDLLEIFAEEPLIGLNSTVRLEQRFSRGSVIEIVGAFARKQERNELGPIRRHFEQSLVHQEFQQVLPPDIDNESHLRPNCGDVRKVLLGTDANVDTARFCGLLQ